MNLHSHQCTDLLVRRLDSIFKLNEPERAAVAALPIHIVELEAGQDIVREGEQPSRSCLLLSGLACIYKITGDGRRQIMAFQIPGDVPDLQSLHLRTLDNSIGTLTTCRLGFIRHDHLRDLCQQFPRITEAFWRTTLIDAAIFREWIANIGQREAPARLSLLLLCETLVRMEAMGLASGLTCAFPINQRRLGEAIGMSTVHVNRTLQQLRGLGLIRLQSGKNGRSSIGRA